MQLLATYTRSKMNEATSKLNPSDTELERRIANEDRPNRFVLSGVYALPFGAGQPYGNGLAPWLRTVVGGWSVSGIYTYQSGAVQTWGNVIYLGGDLEWDPRNVDRAFNIARVQHRAGAAARSQHPDAAVGLRRAAARRHQHAERGAGEEHVARQGRDAPAPRRDVQRASIACSSRLR